eukprot:scpid46336/ scgid30102/ 
MDSLVKNLQLAVKNSLRLKTRLLLLAGALIVIVAVLWVGSSHGQEPGVYQVAYQSDTESKESSSPHLAELDKKQSAACSQGAKKWASTCWQAGNQDRQQLHLAKPYHSTGPRARHGAAVLSATLSVVNGERVATILLTDPRDWLSKADDEHQHKALKQHLQKVQQGEALVSCSFSSGGKRKQEERQNSFGRAVIHPETVLLVIICPLPKTVACCVNGQMKAQAGKHGASPVCVDLQVNFEPLAAATSASTYLTPINVFNYSVCQFGKFYDTVGLTVLLDPQSLAFFPQWMAYHQWLGAKRVIVYLLNGTNLALAKRKLMPYLSDGSVVISAWNVTAVPLEGKGETLTSTTQTTGDAPVTLDSPWKSTKPEDDKERWRRLTVALYTDSLYRYRHSSDSMLIVDARQYILWRNYTHTKDKPTMAAVAPAALYNILPVDLAKSSPVLAVKQAVFQPVVVSADDTEPTKSAPDGLKVKRSRSRRHLPLDVSAAIRCDVGKGVLFPRYAFRYPALLMAWPGDGMHVNGGTAKAGDWPGIRINAYHNVTSSPPCEANVLDMGMHQSSGWGLLDEIIESVRIRYHGSKVDL